MNFLKILLSSGFQIISFIFVMGYFLGVLNIYFSDKNEYCLMTYMYEYPQYVKISVPDNILYPQYGLYAYSEGRFTEKARKMWFDGVPVLYLPGNSGSHMQARSVASVALRKAISGDYDYHFDFFTISYNEELSGLYGGVLQYQTKFAAACINKILSLYKSNKYTKTVPKSVILIGHSMGGIIAKRLLAYPSTLNTTNIAITLAAPLEAPVLNIDLAMNQFYKTVTLEWDTYIHGNQEVKDRKILISIGSGVRDFLMPSVLTSSNDSFINTLSTSVPGVWVSPNHVGIVWCKQLVLVINRFLFDVVDKTTKQVTENNGKLHSKAKQYFQANRSMTLNPDINSNRSTMAMLVDAFWYEDNRRAYQISRPDVDRTTYLMIRLVSFPQNRFLAVETINLEDRDWILACNAKYIHQTYRYCDQAISLGELSRWSGSATDFGKRKLATVHLHDLMVQYPEFTHVIVKVAPTRKPVVLNVDVNDYASRRIVVDLPIPFWFWKTEVKTETEKQSIYYEIIMPNFNTLYQAYFLFVEPTQSCRKKEYHVSAELHIPWAKNHEYYHYFTHLKNSPMKLRLTKTNPNLTYGLEQTEDVKITLILDPKCTFTISIAPSWYHRLAQFARYYTPLLFPYMCAILCLVARSNIRSFQKDGTCLSIHSALASEDVKPYYVLVFARLLITTTASLPIVSYLVEGTPNNPEFEYFIRSLLVVPTYMTALGLLNITAAAVVAVMIFSSQLAHRFLFRIIWRGGPGLTEQIASALQKVPVLVSVALTCSVPLSCGAAALVAGAAFYAFMLSKMFEEYLEDYFYKCLAKFGSFVCRNTLSRNSKFKDTSTSTTTIAKAIKDSSDSNKSLTMEAGKNKGMGDNGTSKLVDVTKKTELELVGKEKIVERECDKVDVDKSTSTGDFDEAYNSLNFHVMLFFLWLSVTLVNVPALLTWARNFKYSVILRPDMSYYPGFILSVCSSLAWQIKAPRKNLVYYDVMASLLFATAVVIIVVGPFYVAAINHGMTIMFVLICVQQVFDSEIKTIKNELVEATDDQLKTNLDSKELDTQDTPSGSVVIKDKSSPVLSNSSRRKSVPGSSNDKNTKEDETQTEQVKEDKTEQVNEDCRCNENRLYLKLKNLKERFSFAQDL